MSVKILPRFLLLSDRRAQIRSWARELFTHTSSDSTETFIDGAKPILKDAGVPERALQRAWALGDRGGELTRFRDRVLERIEDASTDQIARYAHHLGFGD